MRDRLEMSYTELEHDTAELRGLPRLVFLLGEDTEGPAAMFGDLEHGARQHAFRSRLASSGVTTATVTSPGALETELLQALTALPRPEPWPAPSNAAIGKIGRRVWTIPARVRGFTGRAELLAELDAVLRSEDRPSVVQAVTGIGGIGKTTAAVMTLRPKAQRPGSTRTGDDNFIHCRHRDTQLGAIDQPVITIISHFRWSEWWRRGESNP